jgi:hypothetical protein
MSGLSEANNLPGPRLILSYWKKKKKKVNGNEVIW